MNLTRLSFFCLAVAAAGYFGGLVFWPYGQMNPLMNPWRALGEFAKFSYWDGYVLFEGKRIPAVHLPWYYVLKWILITAPLAVIAGAGFFAAFIRPILKRFDFRSFCVILFAAIFPVAYVIYQKSVLYDSGRHFFFIYPLLVVLGACGWDYVFELAKKRVWKISTAVVFILFLIEPCLWMVRNHPNEYVYFNPWVGGLKEAFSHYETDYWGNCLRPAAEWLGDYVNKNEPPDRPIIVRSDSHAMSTFPFLKKALGLRVFLYGYPPLYPDTTPYYQYYHLPQMEGPKGWDYALVFSRNWEPETLQGGAWPPKGTIHEVKADGVTLCAVVKNPDLQKKTAQNSAAIKPF